MSRIALSRIEVSALDPCSTVPLLLNCQQLDLSSTCLWLTLLAAVNKSLDTLYLLSLCVSGSFLELITRVSPS